MKKFDLHCHTAEGSMDAKVSVFDYANKLKSLGYGGMLITDHDAYDGYHAWAEIRGKKVHRHNRHILLAMKRKRLAKKRLQENQGKDVHIHLPSDFVVLKGVEYDTIDAGHILVIMPSRVHLKILELRGLPVDFLIHLVHHHGGILGPAHPFGERYLSFFSTVQRNKCLRVFDKFDFVEVFNACEKMEVNKKAFSIAKKYNKPYFAGSDAHWEKCVGLAYTFLPDNIKTEDDLIAYVKKNPKIKVGGRRFHGTAKDHLGKWNRLLVEGFFFYNKGAGLFRSFHRKNEWRKHRNTVKRDTERNAN